MRKGIVTEECFNTEVGDDKKTDCPLEKLKKCEKRFVGTHCALEGEEEIKKEIQANGPVMSIMIPYRDLLVYSSGDFVIEEKSKLEGLLIIKIVGWETMQDGRGVWLVEPLWGKEFGQDGLVRVKMGSEESLIEKFAYILYPEKLEEKQESEKKEKEQEEQHEKETGEKQEPVYE